MNEQLSIKIASCDGVDLLIVSFPSVAATRINIESESIPSQAQAGCTLTSVNLTNPIDCCISCDNSAAFLFDFLQQSTHQLGAIQYIIVRVQFGT
eukprot:scaffold70131_cov66-Cyclotella_meneghiniana.AAC.1